MNKKIKVIHSYPVWLPQTQTWMYTQVKYLPDEFETHVVCEKTENLEQFNVPNIHCLCNASRWRFYWDKGLRRLRIRRHLNFLTTVARETNAHILHSHFGNIGWANLGAIKNMGIKHVVTFYGVDVSYIPTQEPFWLNRYKMLFKSADLFLCEGPHMIQQLVAMGCPKEKVKLQHLGIEIDKIAYQPRRWQQGETLRVLIAASFREKKGIPYALEALAKLQHLVPLAITIIGDATPVPRSQKEKHKIMEALKKTGLEPKTRLLGYQPHSVLLEEAYNNHIFISPSVTAADGDTEGGAPVSIVEMMATGMPVISTTHCDIPEVVQTGIKDWLVSERDIEGLAERIKWLIKSPKDWEEMLVNGREHIEKEYNAKKQGERLRELYKSILEDMQN